MSKRNLVKGMKNNLLYPEQAGDSPVSILWESGWRHSSFSASFNTSLFHRDVTQSDLRLLQRKHQGQVYRRMRHSVLQDVEVIL